MRAPGATVRLEVRPIELKQDHREFVRFQWRIYGKEPHWVAPLLWERKSFLHPDKNPFFENADVQAFMAFRDGEAVGTIAATVDHILNRVEPATGMFGFFEFIDDEQVARALLHRALDWLVAQGMDEARGPCSFNLHHEAGLLVEGLDTDPVVLTPHNPPYYERIYLALGLRPVQDLYGWWLEGDAVPERMMRVARRVEERHPNLRLRPLNLGDFQGELAHARDLFNEAWTANWGHAPIPEEEFNGLAKGLRAMMHPRLSWFVEDEGRPVAMAIVLLDFNQAIKPMKGHLWPFGWFHLARGRRRINQGRVFLLGVRPSHQHIPIGALLYSRLWEEAKALGLKGAEASWVLESNHRMNRALEKLGAKRYKTWRLYNIQLRAQTVF